MSNNLTKTIASYDKIASSYAVKTENSINTVELNKFLELLTPGSKILDVGCAHGRDSAIFVKNGHSSTGIDLSKGLLEQAKLIHPEIPTRLMDMRKLEFEDAGFHAIWAYASLLHLERKDVPKTLAEFYRVLKPQGICFVCVKEGSGEAEVVEDHASNEPRFFTYFTEDELVGYFKAAGFSVTDHYVYNGWERDVSKRPIDWLVVFGMKG